MSTVATADSGVPIFRAVSSSARQLFQLLNCIRFASKVQVHISSDGIRFAVEESRVMQGAIFLDKALFTSFHYDNTSQADSSDGTESSRFQISLPALLETLQIFGASESSLRFSKPDSDGYGTNIRPHRQNAFSHQALGMTGICRFSYYGPGEPFGIILEEAGVVTTCNLTTYESESLAEVSFDVQAVEVKIIMEPRFLFDAINEISSMIASTSTSSNRLHIVVLPTSPFLSLSGNGPFGTASVEFAESRELFESFAVARRWTQVFKFEMIRAASEAMRLASKVSFRGDSNGVLSLQFMVEVEGGGISFVDFRFVPFIGRKRSYETDEGDEDDDENEE